MDSGVLKAATFAVVTFVMGVIFTVWGLEGYLAHHGGIDGQVRVSTCDEVDPNEWSCEGTFVSDDGAVRIAGIDIMPIYVGPHPGDNTSPAAVSGPEGSTAWLASEGFPMLLVVGIVMFVGFVVSVIVLVRIASASAPAPVAPGVLLLATPVVATPVVLPPGSPRPNRVIWKVVAVGWLLPLAALTVAISEYNRFNAAQESRLVQTGDGVVTEVGDRVIGVTLTAPDGDTATVRVTPTNPTAYPEGTRIPYRFDPSDPGFALPLDESPFEALWVVERDSWSQFVFLLGIALAVVWTWRLGRWGTGMLRRGPEPGTARARVAAPAVGPGSLWLEIVDSAGTRWHQRVLWDRRLIETLAAGPAEPEFAVGLCRCLGFRRMYLVDVPGVGRLWPGSTARRRPPLMSTLRPFEPTAARPGGSVLRLALGVVLPIALIAAAIWYVADPTMAALAATLLVAFPLWRGAVPGRGLYLTSPEASSPRR
ncbi:hypothetical protein SAMN05421812_11558 [Asanoa hainanensis]|uniref:DUF3592 domain-containing protein n=1 Tax=Asanoa hainanensis TaxID=560556 RepID=A0A239P8L8_9ACTN|nr:hypothetical protein [Asanoa hainanensis]SNT63325.1 hypothetical protein SAMN05421812_11558 [Asanoa hainanensis]